MGCGPVGSTAIIAFLVALAALAGGGCQHPGDRPSVFLIVIDALRPDHLGCYGYSRNTSPHIDRLAGESTRFQTAVTVFPRTTPSAVSMLTGVYPHTHGVRSLTTEGTKVLDRKRKELWKALDRLVSNLSSSRFPTYRRALRRARENIKRIPSCDLFDDWIQSQEVSHPTLGEVLRQEDYLTAAFVNHPILPRVPYFVRGFDQRVFANRDSQVTASAKSWLDFVQKWERPVFVVLWYLDPHFPYDPPRPLLERMAEKSEIDLQKLLKRGMSTNRRAFNRDLYSPAERKLLIDAYDATILADDIQVGDFVGHLKKRGWYDDALVILTSDHGESLGEHDFFFEHGEYYYDATALVPLLIKSPRQKSGDVFPHQVRTIDLFPTTLGLLGIDGHPAEGKNLFPGSPREHKELESLLAFGENDYSLFSNNRRRYLKGIAGKWRIARSNRYKLIYIPHPQEPIFEFYDIQKDPGEESNLIADPDYRGEIESLKKQLFDWIKKEDLLHQRGEEDLEGVGQDTMERLRSLGYVE